jgi:hypothetical protein
VLCFGEKKARSGGFGIATGNGVRRRESAQTEDWNEAQRKLRERLQARDDNILDTVKKGESMSFAEWADFFLENYSKPPSAQRVRTKST